MQIAAWPALLALTLLCGCNFHLRGEESFALPFQSLYIQSERGYTPFVDALKRAVQAAGVELVGTRETAQLTLEIVSETEGKQILALSSAGRVREFQLRYRISFRAVDSVRREWIPAQELELVRNLPYDDTQVLAKGQEEALLYQDMRTDAVQQLLRRMVRARPVPAQ